MRTDAHGIRKLTEKRINLFGNSIMYLARRVVNNRLCYVLCESYERDGCLRNRDLVDLGPEPERFIRYSGGSAFHLADELIQRLRQQGIDVSQDELEEFFLPFLDPYVQAKISPFQDRQKYRHWRPMPVQEKNRILAETHVFDRRRVHYLRFGMVDQRRLDRSPTLYKRLLDKSRDEIEQDMIAQEQALSPGEYKRYVFTIFDLQRHFRASYARTTPQALDGQQLDLHFLEDLCRLDQDRSFWMGFSRTDRLPPYLIRYLVMYFDYEFPAGRNRDDFTRFFRGTGQRTRIIATQRVSVDEATRVMGLTRQELAAMNRKELTKLYRKKAHKLHPDKGGDHDRFIELTAAYNELLRTRRD